MPDMAFVDGQIVPLEEARVPLLDRNVTFADTAYEVMRSIGEVLLFEDPHWDRLERTLRALDIAMPDRAALSTMALQLVRAAGYRESVYVIHVSRGIGPRSRVDDPAAPTWYAWVTERSAPPRDRLESGISLVSVPDDRWKRCDLKTTMLLPSVLASRRARVEGAYDALFVTNEGLVNEATAANVAVFLGRTLVTPGRSPRILGGITRDVVVETARAGHWTVEERDLPLHEMLRADEAFLTGTTVDVLPVVEVDRVRIGTGRPGQETVRLAAAYERRCRDEASPTS